MLTRAFRISQSVYPFYLSQHRHPLSRRLHFTGTLLAILLFTGSLLLQRYGLLLFITVAGYGFAWTGHFFFEKNRPATFKYPLYSLMGDFVMFWQILIGTFKHQEQ
jgi:hypothetical protein